MADKSITPAILQTLAVVEYDEEAQHERAFSAKRLSRDDMADGRAPDQRLVSVSLACACQACCASTVDWAAELGPWLDATPPSPVERFVAERCERTPGRSSDTTPAEFYEAFLAWAHANDENTAGVSVIGLGRELSARLGIRSTATQGIRTYRGLAVRPRPTANGDSDSANGAIRAQPVGQDR